jgi:hypothetical protein
VKAAAAMSVEAGSGTASIIVRTLFEGVSVCLVRWSNLGQRGFAYGIRALVIALLIGKPEDPREEALCVL